MRFVRLACVTTVLLITAACADEDPADATSATSSGAGGSSSGPSSGSAGSGGTPIAVLDRAFAPDRATLTLELSAVAAQMPLTLESFTVTSDHGPLAVVG